MRKPLGAVTLEKGRCSLQDWEHRTVVSVLAIGEALPVSDFPVLSKLSAILFKSAWVFYSDRKFLLDISSLAVGLWKLWIYDFGSLVLEILQIPVSDWRDSGFECSARWPSHPCRKLDGTTVQVSFILITGFSHSRMSFERFLKTFITAMVRFGLYSWILFHSLTFSNVWAVAL